MPLAKDNLHYFLAEGASVAIVEDDIELSPPVEVEKDEEEKGDCGNTKNKD